MAASTRAPPTARVTIEVLRPAAPGSVDLRTTNGSVRCAAAQRRTANLSASCVNGEHVGHSTEKREIAERSAAEARSRGVNAARDADQPRPADRLNGGVRERPTSERGRGHSAIRGTVNEDKATRYHRLKRQREHRLAGVGRSFWRACSRPAERRPPVIAASVVRHPDRRFWFTPSSSLPTSSSSPSSTRSAALPLAFYGGFLLERRYGLSNEAIGGWLADQVKSLGSALLLGGAAAAILYVLIRVFAGRWWLPAGAAFALLIVGLANLRRCCCCRCSIA